MLARRYELNVIVARTVSHSFAALTHEILFLPLEHKIHIFSLPCNILYIFLLCRWTPSTANQNWRQYTKDAKFKDLGTDEYAMAVLIYHDVSVLFVICFFHFRVFWFAKLRRDQVVFSMASRYLLQKFKFSFTKIIGNYLLQCKLTRACSFSQSYDKCVIVCKL